MADVNATFVYDADFTSAVSQTRTLSRELSTLNKTFNSLDKDARKVRDRFGEIFKGDIGDLGAFSARTVDITSNMDSFGKSLDRNKLKLRDYAREARKAFKADSNSRMLAEDQVRRSRANLVEMGMDASGRRKGILVTPLKLDMSDMQTQLEVSRKQFSIFNRLINDGATQLINWGKNTQWAGRQLTVGLTVPMTIFATTTIKAFNDVDKELTRFQKVYGSDLVGATTQATNAIRQQVQALTVELAGAYGIAAKETAGLAADLAATGLEGQKLLDSIKQTTRLGVLGEIDRQDAMKTTLSLQNAFNMSTQELTESINFLNAVENQTSLSLQDLTEAIPKVGPVVRALGGDVKDLSVLMVAMKEGGINAAEGANALKSGLASLINPTKAGSEVAKQYGIDLEDIVKRNKGQLLPTVLEFQKSMETLDDLGKAKIIEQLFGKYQFARISALFDNLNTQGSQTKQVIELMSASNSDLARIANAEIKTLTESASMRFQRSMEAIKAALLPVGETIVNSVLPFMEKFAGVLDRIVSFAQNLPGPIKSFLKIAGGLTAIAGPLIMMTGVLGNFLGYLVKGSMAFVNLGRRIRGLPTEKFSLMDDAQIAAAKATDVLTISVEKQKSAMIGLNKIMMDYYSLINRQAAKTPNLFNSTPLTSTIGGSPVVPKGTRTLPIIRRQSGGPAYVPGFGSGDKIPALLEPGEFVINREATKQYGGLLEDINNGVPRFQSGGKMPRKIPVPGYRIGRTDLVQRQATERAGRLRAEAQGGNSPVLPNTRQSRSLKFSNPKRIFGATKAENQLLNDLFQAGRHANSSPSRVALRNAILSQIDQMAISPKQKTKLRRAIEINRNFSSVEDQKLFSDLIRETISNPSNLGIMDEISTDLKAKLIATMLVPEKRVVSRVSSLSNTESGSNLSSTFSSTRSIRGAFGPAGERARDESFLNAFGGRQSASKSFESIISRMESEYGIPRSISEKYIGILKTEGAHGLQSGGPIKAQRGITGPKPFSGVPTVKVNPFKLIGMGGVNEDNPIAGLDEKSGMFYKQIKNNRGFNKDAMISEAVFSQIYKSGLFGENVTGIDQRLFNADTGNGTMPVLGSKFIESLRTGDNLFDGKPRKINKPRSFDEAIVDEKAVEAMLASKILGNYDTHNGNFGISNGKFVMLDNTSNLLTDANGLQRRTSQALNDFSYSPDRDALDRLGTQAYRKNSGSEKATIKYLDGILAKLNDGQSYVSQAIMRATQGSPELLKSMNDYAFKKSRGASKTYEELVTSMIALRVEKMKSNLYVDEDNLTLADGGPRLALQSGGMIKAMRGINMPESYATKLGTIRQSMANANKEAMSSNIPLTELGTRQSRIGGFSSAIPGVNGIYEINGNRYVVKGHDTYESAKAEAEMAKITRDVFGLQSPNQEAVRIKHPETGDFMFAVRSPYNEVFAKTTGRFTEDSAFDQLIASVVRRDKDLQADNLFDDIVTDVGQAGIMSKASQPRIKTGPTNSALEQLAINLGMTKSGARSHGAEAWNAATANMTDAQIISRIKQAAANAKARFSSSDIPEDFKYISKDLDDIASADLGPFVAHLRTVFPKEKKPLTEAAIAKKEQQKLLDRQERQSALDAGYPAWAMQGGGIIKAQRGITKMPGVGSGLPYESIFAVGKKAEPFIGPLPQISYGIQGTYKPGGYTSMFEYPFSSRASAESFQATDPRKYGGAASRITRDINDPQQQAYADWIAGHNSGQFRNNTGAMRIRDMEGHREQMLKSMSPISQSIPLYRGTVLREKGADEFSGAGARSLLMYIKHGMFEKAIGKKIQWSDMQSFSSNPNIASYGKYIESWTNPSNTNSKKAADRKLQSMEMLPVIFRLANSQGQDGFNISDKAMVQEVMGRTVNEKEWVLNNPSGTISGISQDIKTKNYIIDLMQSGGIFRAQDGAWVPGSGEGDRVPAMLEPGEFVVNKNAAKQYGGVLEDLNWNVAPRFNQGGMAGMKTGAIGGALLSASFLLPMMGVNEKIQTLILTIGTLTSVLSAVQMLMVKTQGADAVGGMTGMLKSPKAALARLGPMLANPWVLATAAIGTAAFAIYKYRDSIKQAGKDGKAIFDSQTEAAKVLGIELKTTAQNMEAISGNFDVLQPTVKSASILTPEQRDEIAKTDQNKRIIEQLKSSQDAQSILLSQYSRMILDGMMPEEAMAIVKLLAERSGKAQDFFKAAPRMGAISNAETPQKQFSMAMGTFINALGSLGSRANPTIIPQQGIDYSQGNNTVYYDPNIPGANMTAPRNPNLDPLSGQQFVPVGTDTTVQELTRNDKARIKGGVTGALEAAQMAPDLSSFIKGMDQLSKSLVKLDEVGKGVGLSAITEFAKTKYGEESSFFKAFDTLPDNLNTVENKLMLITAEAAGVNFNEFLMDGELVKEELNAINQQLKQVGINAEIDLRIKNAATAQLEKIEKQAIAVQSSYDSAITKNEQLVDAENERYKKDTKAHQAFIKDKNKEIDTIEKQTDIYLKSLTKQDDANKFRAEQRGTMLGGLGALAEGDVFGFLDAQMAAEENAKQFSISEEIKAIEETSEKRVEAIQQEIDKRQEAADMEDEKHEAKIAQLEKQRVAAQKNYTEAMTNLGEQEQALQNISTYTGPDFAKMISGYEATASLAAKVAAAEAAITALSQGKSVDDAIKAGQDYLSKHALSSSSYNNQVLRDSGYQGAGMILKADGGYISGPGTGTSDSIPARLSNGEYVVKASAVDQYGVGMMNSINEQRFADGGLALDDYSRVTYGGKTFNARTVRMLKQAEQSYGSGFQFYQGSYNTGVAASMGTHDGGGAVDIKPPANISKALGALSSAGFYARFRDLMNPPHIHAIAYGDKELSAAARRQLGLPANENSPVEGSNASAENIAAVLSALGTNMELVNTVRSKGVRGLMTPRQFGGSMTMNKPYLVGENGPEVVVPYGSGSRVDPKFNVPENSSITTVSQTSGGIINDNSSGNMVVNLSVNGVNDPSKAANRVIEILNSEAKRRNHSRKMGR